MRSSPPRTSCAVLAIALLAGACSPDSPVAPSLESGLQAAVGPAEGFALVQVREGIPAAARGPVVGSLAEAVERFARAARSASMPAPTRRPKCSSTSRSASGVRPAP